MMEHAEHSPAAIREKAAGAVNCQSVTLPSGLTVLCRTMPGYSSVHAMYATNFGSVVREFTLNGKRIQLPAGTAHFLEHKMFESEQGDAFDLYAKTGAAANAFTSYDRTCYIFTATGMTDENLDILLNMVGHPWFTKETIAKEQGIIGQEIKMYDDSPDWRLLTALFRCLYKSHPIHPEHCRADARTAVRLHRCVLPPRQHGTFRCGQHHAGSGCGSLPPQRCV